MECGDVASDQGPFDNAALHESGSKDLASSASAPSLAEGLASSAFDPGLPESQSRRNREEEPSTTRSNVAPKDAGTGIEHRLRG